MPTSSIRKRCCSSVSNSLIVGQPPESQNPKFFAGVDLSAARLCRVRIENNQTSRFSSEVLSQKPLRVFVCAALPRALRITEIDFHFLAVLPTRPTKRLSCGD